MEDDSKRGPCVIFGIIIIVFIIIVGGFLGGLTQDNYKLQGRYEGTASYPNHGVFEFIIEFDGEGRCNGTFGNETDTISFHQEYQVFDEDFVFTFTNGTVYYLFQGVLDNENTRVHGLTQIRMGELMINGTFEIEAVE